MHISFLTLLILLIYSTICVGVNNFLIFFYIKFHENICSIFHIFNGFFVEIKRKSYIKSGIIPILS
jgi:hypothetical protein